MALRRRFDAVPFGRVHPSWVARAIPDEPLAAVWCLAELPRAERLPVLRELPAVDRPAVLNAQAPAWFAAWWRRHLRGVITYPWPAAETLDRSAPLTYLDRLPTDDLLRLLRCFGLRSLAAVVHGLEPQAVVAIAVSLPPVSRDRLAKHSRSGRHPDPAPWTQAFEALRQEGALPADAPLLLALEDVGAQAPGLGEVSAAARIAYRLPARWGERLLARLARGPGELEHPSPDQWQRDLVTDLGHLARHGVVTSPLARGGLAA
ncbi:MAG: hypothetical protein ACRD2Z_13690 [Thermoanaerobaculia bacterium]